MAQSPHRSIGGETKEKEMNPEAQRLFSNPSELEQVLYAMNQPDNANLKKATLLLGDFMDEPKSIMALLQQMDGSSKPEVRQIAAIYLREQIEAFWKKIPDDVKGKLREFLLRKLFSVEEKAERIAIAAATTSCAKFVMVKGEWPELLMALDKACKPDSPIPIRETGHLIWRNILQFCGGSLKKNFGKILTIMTNGLKVTDNPKIQVESVKAIGAMIEFLEHEKEVDIIQSVIPSMVDVINQCLKRGDEDAVIEGMEVFIDMIESSVPVLSKHGVQLTQFMLKIAQAQKQLPLVVRKQAVNFMTFTCKTKPKIVIKHGMVQEFLGLCINLILESKEMEEEFAKPANRKGTAQVDMEDTKDGLGGDGIAEEDEEDVDLKADTEFVSPLAIACDLMDELFLNLPSESCFPLATKAVQQLLNDKDPFKRKAGYVIMAMMVEGCASFLSKGNNLEIMLKAAFNGVNDPNPVVRKCSLEVITQLCTHLADDMIKWHKQVLACCFSVFKREKEDIRVKERALSAVEMFIDTLDDFNLRRGVEFKIGDYLTEIMNTIGNCLKSKNKALQIQSVATLASTAAAARDAFVPFLPQVLSLLEQLLQIDDKEQLELRAEATGCLGAVATAAGKKHWGPHLVKFHTFVMSGIRDFDNSSIRESSFMYFSDLSALMGKETSDLPTFQDMLYSCIMTMADDDGLIVELPDDGFSAGMPKGFVAAQNKLDELDDFDAEAGLTANTDDLDEFDRQQAERKLNELNDDELQAIIEEAVRSGQQGNELAEAEEEELIAQAVGQMKSVKLAVTTGFMEEKAAAIHCISQFFKKVGFGMLQYIEDIWEQIVYLWEYPHPLVKMALCNCVHELLTLVAQYSMRDAPSDKVVRDEDGIGTFNWSQGDDSIEFDSILTKWIDNVYGMAIQAIHDEDDKDTLASVLDNFGEQLRMLGPSSVSKHMETLASAINNFFGEKVNCFANADVDNEDTQNVASKHKFVSDTMAELLGVLSELWGQKFVPVFIKLYPNIMRWSHESRHTHDHAMAVGAIADVATRLERAGNDLLAPIADNAYKVILRVAQSQDSNTRQNALYAIGALALVAGSSANLEHSQNLLRCVNSYMKFPRDGSRGDQLTRDNAVSALGKLIKAETDALPTAKLLPAFLQSLPLTKDYSEYFWVFNVIIHMIENEKELIEPHMPMVLGILVNGLMDESVGDRSKNSIAGCLNKLCQSTEIQKLIDEKMTGNQKEIIQKCLSQSKSDE